MKHEPATIVSLRDAVRARRKAANQRLRKALELLPAGTRECADNAVIEIEMLDRWLDELRFYSEPRSIGSVPEPQVARRTSTIGRGQTLKAEAEFWSPVAQMIGRDHVNAATVRTLAARVGAELTAVQAARKLQTWLQAGYMERTSRGRFAFNEKGFARYGIAISEEEGL